MSGRAARLFLLCALGVALGGCPQERPPTLESNIYPSDFKHEIVVTLKAGVFDKNDTTTITDAVVSDPVLQEVGKEQHYISCIRYTAHGTEYNLSSSVTRIAYFYGGHVNQVIPANQGECDKAVYKPFAELNAFCTGIGCKKQ
jgi:hypothetical protein